MAPETFRPEDFKPGRLTRVFALLSVVFVVVLASAPLYVFFGWLSDRVGRKPIIMGGLLIAALTAFAECLPGDRVSRRA